MQSIYGTLTNSAKGADKLTDEQSDADLTSPASRDLEPLAVPRPAPGSFASPPPLPPVQQVATEQSFWARLVFTWLCWRACAIGPWIWVLSAVLHKAFGTDILPCPGWVLLTPLVTLVVSFLGAQMPPPLGSGALLLFNPVAVLVYVIFIAPCIWIYVLFWKLPKASLKLGVVLHLLTHPVA